MKLLLDTHIFLWWADNPEKLEEDLTLVSVDSQFIAYPVKLL